MRYLVGFALAVALAGLPLKANGQENFFPEPWLVLELDSSGVKMVRTEGDLWGHEYHFPGVND